MTTKTLIIGGAGFLGNSLSKYLADCEIPVSVLDSQLRIDKYAIPQRKVEYLSCDWPSVSGYKNLGAYDNVIHLAWSTNPTSSMKDIPEDASANVIGTLKLLESIPVNGINKFIFMSSGGTVYGNANTDIYLESNLPQPVSAYGISKLSCEKYVELYALRKKFIPINIRLGNPYGSYQLQGTPIGVIANFVSRIFSGVAIDLYGNGEIVRDYVHIDDFLTAMNRILRCKEISGTYNLGSGVGNSLAKIIDSIESITDRSFKINYLRSRRSDVRSVVLNSEKLSNTIGNFNETSIEKGIERIVDSYVDYFVSSHSIPADHPAISLPRSDFKPSTQCCSNLPDRSKFINQRS